MGVISHYIMRWGKVSLPVFALEQPQYTHEPLNTTLANASSLSLLPKRNHLLLHMLVNGTEVSIKYGMLEKLYVLRQILVSLSLLVGVQNWCIYMYLSSSYKCVGNFQGIIITQKSCLSYKQNIVEFGIQVQEEPHAVYGFQVRNNWVSSMKWIDIYLIPSLSRSFFSKRSSFLLY